MHTISEKKLLMLRPSEIRPALYSSRMYINEARLDSLSMSISQNGIIEPIAVRKNERGFYEIISGNMRLAAARRIGMRRVPCILHSVSQKGAAMLALSSNVNTVPLHFFESGESARELSALGWTHAEIALKCGMSYAQLNARLKLLKLDESIKEDIYSADLGEALAVKLLKIPQENRRGALDKMIEGELGITAADELIDKILSGESGKTQKKEPAPPPPVPAQAVKTAVSDMRIFTNSLTHLADSMRGSGFDTSLSRRETDKYIEYKLKIKKTRSSSEGRQLSFNIG